MRKDQRGSATIWMLGLSLLILMFGGLALDFWRALALQRELAAVADSAAVAAASGLDEEHYRSTGEVVLAPDRSRLLAFTSIENQDLEVEAAVVEISADGLRVTVQLQSTLNLGLLGILIDESRPLSIESSATAEPQVVP